MDKHILIQHFAIKQRVTEGQVSIEVSAWDDFEGEANERTETVALFNGTLHSKHHEPLREFIHAALAEVEWKLSRGAYRVMPKKSFPLPGAETSVDTPDAKTGSEVKPDEG